MPNVPPPPPRIAKNMSVYWHGLEVMIEPLGRTMVASSKLSLPMPYVLERNPWPPPVSHPTMPTLGFAPLTIIWLWGSRYAWISPLVWPAATRTAEKVSGSGQVLGRKSSIYLRPRKLCVQIDRLEPPILRPVYECPVALTTTWMFFSPAHFSAVAT